MPEMLDRCVQHLMDKGYDKESAYPICQMSVDMKEKEGAEAVIKMAEDMAKKKMKPGMMKPDDMMTPAEMDRMKKKMMSQSINGVEIFAAGKWNGDTYNESDLDTLVTAFEETKGKLKPYLKLGHGGDQSILRADEMPAAGYIANLYRVGKKLLADFVNVPDKIFELIKRRAYSKVSSEIYQNIHVDGKKYPWALKAVALLGGETPAVHDLDEILALGYSHASADQSAEMRRYDFSTNLLTENREELMELEALKKENEELKEKVKTLSEQNQVLQDTQKKIEGSIEEIRKFAEAQKSENESLKKEKRFSDISAKVAKLVESKKITPAQAEKLKVFIAETPIEKTFKVGEQEFAGTEALIFSMLEENQNGLSTEERSEIGKPKDQDLDANAKEFMAKHNVSYKEALIAVASGNK